MTKFISLQYAWDVEIGWWSLCNTLVVVINVSQNVQYADTPAGLILSLVLDDNDDCINVWFFALYLDGILHVSLFDIGMPIVKYGSSTISELSLTVLEEYKVTVIMGEVI